MKQVEVLWLDRLL
jgi:TIGR00729: ribonuclease HII